MVPTNCLPVLNTSYKCDSSNGIEYFWLKLVANGMIFSGSSLGVYLPGSAYFENILKEILATIPLIFHIKDLSWASNSAVLLGREHNAYGTGKSMIVLKNCIHGSILLFYLKYSQT